MKHLLKDIFVGLARKHRRKSLEMRATDEIAGVNTFHGTHVVASAAACTLLIINGCKVVFNLNCSLGTGFFTFTAADTSVGADLANLGALVVAGAFDDHA